MFDDIPTNKPNQPPQNLPFKEPEDIFAGREESVAPTEIGAPSVESMRARAEGVGKLEPVAMRPVTPMPMAGGLKPVNMAGAVPKPTVAPTIPPQTTPATGMNYEVKEPKFGKIVTIIASVIAAILLLLGGSWWLYNKFIKGQPGEILAPEIEQTTTTTNENQELNNNLNEVPGEQEVPVDGVPADRDKDGLDDFREMDLGTDPANWDTDSDELSDYDEVTIWKTDPLNSDSDGDTFLDGREVKAGYSPTGPGRLFEIPTSATSS